MSLAFEALIENTSGACDASSKVWIICLRFCRVVSTRLCISAGGNAKLLDFFGTLLLESDHMSTQVLQLMFVDYVAAFAPCCDSVIVDDGCLSTVGNDGSKCSVGKHMVLNETGYASATESSNVPTLDSGSSSYTSVTWSDFVVSVDNDRSIECERMTSEASTTEGSVGVSESKISGELENGMLWQPSSEPWDCDFFLYHRAFPGT